MNAKKMTLALASLALFSTGSAYAQIDAQVGPVEATIGAPTAAVGAPVVTGTGCATVAPACKTGGLLGTGLLGKLFSPPGGRWLDINTFGLGLQLGGRGPALVTLASLGPNAMIYPTGVQMNGCGIQTLSSAAVIINTCGGTAQGLCGERVGNPWIDLHLLRFGFSMGKVNPDYDMRPAGDI
jgi:hypothetical protein